jgi:uracil-DNA glycosylase
MRLDAATAGELRRLARTLDALDVDAYRACARDPLEPIIGLGPANAPLCFMGRDPGRREVEQAQPFVGEAGQLLRAGLHAHLHPAEPYTPAAGLAAGAGMFWMNTVPYKPVGNKAWSAKVRAQFHPVMAHVLARWRGADVVTLGNEAFAWFKLGQARPVRDVLRAFWSQGDARYSRSIEVTLDLAGRERTVRLHPLPHPSRANAVWCARFPALWRARVQALLPLQRPSGSTG